MAQSRRRRDALLAVVAVAWGLVALLRGSRVSPVRVAGDSMEPTLRDGDLLAVSPLRAEPSFGSIVVVRRAAGAEDVKRVIGTPGDRLRVGPTEMILAAGQFAVAGDNRRRSTDSRRYDPVSREDLVAVVRACYWPPRSWRLFAR
jgi:signal peptidase I